MAFTSRSIVLVLLFFAATITSTLALDTNVSWTPMTTPAVSSPPLKSFFLSKTQRRRLVGRFQICALCTCCGGPRGVCIPSPCCYAINCNIPNRPFGVCAFTPRTCNCFNCHL